MSVFSERFESSSISAFLEDTIAELEAIDLAQLGAGYREIVVRTKHIVTTVSEQLSGIDPEFLSATLVDELKTSAQHLLEAAQRCKREGSWNNLTKGGDGLLHYFAQIPKTWHPDKSLKSTNRDLAKYKKDVGKALADANAALEKLAEATASVNERLAAIEQCTLASTTDLDTRIGAVSKEIENLEASRTELTEELVQTREELDELHHATKALVDQIRSETLETEQQQKAEFKQWCVGQEHQCSELIERQTSAFAEKMNEWSTALNVEENKCRAEFSQSQNERSTEFSTLKDQFTSALSVQQTEWDLELTSARTAHEKAFSDDSESRATRLRELDSRWNSKLTEFLANAKSTIDEASKNYATGAEQHLGAMVQLEEEARKLVGLIGNTGVTGSYQKIADRELNSANWMRGTAIGAIVVLTLLVVAIIWEIGTVQFVWEVMLFRLLAGLPLVGLAWYCGKESARHRTNEERNRRIELELAALSPYLHQLPEDKAILVRESLTAKYFGNESTGQLENSESLGTMLRTLSKNLEPIIEFAKKFNK